MKATVGRIACTPFPDNSVKTEKHGDGDVFVIKVANTKTKLVKLKVLFNCRFALGGQTVLVEADDYVWVRADLYASTYGKEVFVADSEPFILLPTDRIEVIEAAE